MIKGQKNKEKTEIVEYVFHKRKTDITCKELKETQNFISGTGNKNWKGYSFRIGCLGLISLEREKFLQVCC